MNQQPIEHQSLLSDGSLFVHSMFFTIQGEGPCAGRPAVFVRLTGCNLQCPLCDTDYSGGVLYTPVEIVKRIQPLIVGVSKRPIIVITGGEPFRQNIAPLVRLLADKGFLVQIETNGTLYVPGPWHEPNVMIVVSPKTPKVHERTASFATAFKYVACESELSPFDGLPIGVLGGWSGGQVVARPPSGFKGRVYLQPADVKDDHMNKVHRDAVVNSCMKYGYTLCLQLHKILEME